MTVRGDDFNYYEFLGLKPDASISDIKKAYRNLVKAYHPDISSHPKAKENFQKIQEAYEVLNDEKKRSEYDTSSVNTRRGRSESDTSEEIIEHSFYAKNESLRIKGIQINRNKFLHLIINGQEFIEFNGKRYQYNRKNFPFDLHEIESEYFVDEETVNIDGKNLILENAHHVISKGLEYIEYQGNYLQFADRQETKTTSGIPGTKKLLAGIAIILVIAFATFFGPLTLGIIYNQDENNEIFVPSEVTENINYSNHSAEKLRSQEIQEAMDYENPAIKKFSLSLIDTKHISNKNIADICDRWDEIYSNWTYVSNPPRHKKLEPANRTIEKGLKGDSGDFSILIASLIEAVGGKTRIISTPDTDGKYYTYSEVFITAYNANLDSMIDYVMNRYNCSSVFYDIEYEEGRPVSYWLNLDFHSKHPGGKFAKTNDPMTVYYPDGSWERFQPER